MENPIDNFWKLKLENVKESLESNNFEVFIVDNSVDHSVQRMSWFLRVGIKLYLI